MPRRSVLALTAASVLAAATALGHGVSPHVAGLHDALDERIDQLPPTDPVTKTLRKAEKLLDRHSNEASLGNELASVAKAQAAIAKGAPDESVVLDHFEDALLRYASDLDATWALLRGAETAQGLPKSVRRKVAKALAQLAATDLDYPSLARAAKAAKGWTPYEFGRTHVFVVESLSVAPAGQGLDVDGDRKPDNALGTFRTAIEFLVQRSLDELLAEALGDGGAVVLIEVAGVQSAQRDPLAFVGLFGAADVDADPSDNFSGSEPFLPVDGSLAADGHAAVRSATKLRRGKFAASFVGAGLPIPGVPASGGRAAIAATLGVDSLSGRIGAAIPIDDLVALFGLAGSTISRETIADFADADLDGDGEDDAFTLALDFTAVPATIEQDV